MMLINFLLFFFYLNMTHVFFLQISWAFGYSFKLYGNNYFDMDKSIIIV